MTKYRDIIRKEIKAYSTKSLIKRYKGMNDDGRLEARKELLKRKVKRANLPFKPRKKNRSNRLNYFDGFRF